MDIILLGWKCVFNEMLNKMKSLEEENQRLSEQLEQETENRRQIQSRIERLLERN